MQSAAIPAQAFGGVPLWTWLLLAAGILFALMAGTWALLAARRARWIERLVTQRTAELAQINEKLAEEICDHLNTEHALDKERESLKAVLDNLHEGILVLDEDGRVRIANGAAFRIYASILGSESDAVDELTPFDFYGSPDRRNLRGDHWPHARALSGETVRGHEIDTHSTHGGAPVVMSINAQPLMSGGGRQHGAVMVVRDITDLKRVERLKAEFVATVSHELRTPITSIRGSLGLVAAGTSGPLGDKTKHLIDIALRNSDRLAHLINDLLDIEKIESGHMRFNLERQRLCQLIELAIEANSGYAESFGVRLAFAKSDDDSLVRVDPYRLLQVLANLLSNAIKFSPRDAVVEVAMERLEHTIRVLVRDHGTGIPAEFHDRIFHKFSQADSSDARNRSGTGLGLAICKAIVEQMRGSIGFQTELGKGSTFHFELPLANESEIASSEIVR